MTTRAQLESEREALIDLRSHFEAPSAWHAALTASIARLDALLSLSDEQCAYLVGHEEELARHDSRDAAFDDVASKGYPRPSETAAAHRTVAEIVRRS